MKKFILLFAFILQFSVSLQAQWSEILPGNESYINEISLVNDNIIWLRDQEDSLILFTLDGGVTWTKRTLPVEIRNNYPGGISAVSATTAFIVAGQGAGIGIFKTTNGGLSWTKQISGYKKTTSYIDFIHFWNENEGVVVGDAYPNENFEIYTTSDGGTHWNPVQASAMPSGNFSSTFNSSAYYRVRGNTFYFSTVDGYIFKSADKGLSWTKMKTPLGLPLSFDFKDDNHGVISYYNVNGITDKQYVTSDGGLNWTQVNVTNYIGSIKYLNDKQVYFATRIWKGLIYSADNGMTWTEHPSLKNAGLNQTVISPNGTIYIGGWGKIYKTTNYLGLNPVISKLTLKTVKTLDIEFDRAVEISSAQDLSHYKVSYRLNNSAFRIDLASATKDNINDKLVHLITQTDMPVDTITVNVNNIKDLSGFPVIENSFGARSTVIVNEEISNTKDIWVPVAGMLSSLLTKNEKNAIVNLTLSGKIDARDVKYMRDSIPLLSVLNLGAVNIMEYSGSEGTATDVLYLANQMPACSFVNINTWEGKSTLTSVILPNSITSVAWSAFESCTGLSGNITIPASVNSIEDWAFYNCGSLTGFDVESANQNYAQKDGVLFNKEQTTLVLYPSGKQDSYVIPATVNTIGYYSFFGCSGLKGSVTLPSTVITIEHDAFNQSYGLTDFIVDAANQIYSSNNGVMFNKDKSVLVLYPAGKAGSCIIPSYVSTIGTGAFAGCNLLTGTLVLPNTITTLESSAFSDCYGLTGSLEIPSSINRIPDDAFYNCYGLTGLTLNESIKHIGSFAFSFCEKISGKLIIPDAVDTIGYAAFYQCTGITEVTIGNSVKDIGSYAFGWCSGLTGHLEIPNSVVSIGYAAFTRCSALTKLTLGSSVSYIDQYAFNLCTLLSKITSKNATPPTINSTSFNGVNKELCQLVVPNGTVQVYKSTAYWSAFNQTSGLGGKSITVSFKKPADWENSGVNIWAWYNGVNLFTTWPGAPMTDLENGWYSYTFSETVTAVNIVLSKNGSPLTVDINNITQSTCYEQDGLINGMLTLKATDCSSTGFTDNEKRSSLSVYPQPAQDYFNIELPDDYNQRFYTMRILDLSGKELRKETLNGNNKTVNRGDLKSGFYVLQISDKNSDQQYSIKLLFK